MMGRSHALCGLTAGASLAALVPAAPLPIRGLLVVVTGGAALLPDLDHPQATAARSLGLFTKTIARLVDWLSLAVYYGTALPGDPPERKSGHRLLTHTVPASLVAGLFTAALGWVSPVAVAVMVALLGGLLAHGMRVAGTVLFWLSGGVSFWVFSQEPGWSWLISCAVALGCLIHIGGDWVTNSGVPLLWPLVSHGQRWRLVHAPVTFAAGDAVETAIVRPLILYPSLALALAWATGLVGLLLSYWWKVTI